MLQFCLRVYLNFIWLLLALAPTLAFGTECEGDPLRLEWWGGNNHIHALIMDQTHSRLIGTYKEGLMQANLITMDTPSNDKQLMDHFIYSVCTTSDGYYMALGLDNGDVVIFQDYFGSSSSSYQIIDHLTHSDRVYSVAFHPIDEHILATGSEDTSIIVGNILNETEVQILNDHTGSVSVLAYNSDGSRLASAANKVIMWDTTTATNYSNIASYYIYKENGATTSINDLSWSPDGSKIVVGCHNEPIVKILNAADGTELLHFEEHPQGSIRAVAWSPCGNLIASGDWTDLKIWDATSGVELLNFNHGVNSVV